MVTKDLFGNDVEIINVSKFLWAAISTLDIPELSDAMDAKERENMEYLLYFLQELN